MNERLTAAIRTAVRDGRLPHGTALPPGRALAAGLGFPGCTARGAEAAPHVLLELPPGVDAAAVTAGVGRQGLTTCPLDDFRIRPDARARPALVPGCGNLADHAIDEAVRILAGAAARRP